MNDPAPLVLGWRTVMMGMVCLPIVISAFILWFRQKERPAARFLAAFLFAAVLAMGPQIIGFAGFYNRWPGLTYFPLFSTELWLGPLVYLHADRLMRGGALGWRKCLLVPGILQSIYYTWAFFGLGDYRSKWAYNDAVHSPFVHPVENILTIGLLLFATIAIWRMVRLYKNGLEQTQSAAIEYDPVWLRNLVWALIFALVITTIIEIWATVTSLAYDTAFPFQVLIMTLVAWISIEATWRLTTEFPKIGSMDGELESQSNPSRNWEDEAKHLKDKVVSEAWFLEPRLSIRDLASRLGTNETYVSRMLNQGSGQSFNRFINELRIEHAKNLLSETSQSVLNIAYDSGFNSKATFNRVFKDISGQTPSQFKTSQNP